MSELCTITPISAFMSTNLSSKIACYQELGERILRMLGHPMINVELHPDQLYDSISMACEFFTKYAGHTKEYIIFDSRLYEDNKGVRLDHLFTVANTNYTVSQKLAEGSRPNPDYEASLRGSLYVCVSAVSATYFTSSSALSGIMPSDGLTILQVLDSESYLTIIDALPELATVFKVSPQKTISIQCVATESTTFQNMFDYDAMDYRKVISVTDFEEGSSSGVNTLFSMESTMAQQTFYSYAMGNFGFDLLSWHVVKDWMKTREKVLAIRREIHFDNRTQYMRMYPQPRNTTNFVGVLECYVERPIRDIIKEKWILDYSVALSKIMWGRILTHITGVTILGGGSLNGESVLQEGITDKKELEEMLVGGGFGDFEPIGMFTE